MAAPTFTSPTIFPRTTSSTSTIATGRSRNRSPRRRGTRAASPWAPMRRTSTTTAGPISRCYHYLYARNTLQLNRGITGGKLRFSEIGLLAGVAATDWSWAPLFADLDNDGRKDLFVTTGIYRRPNDLDYIASLDSIPARTEPPAARLVAKMPRVPEPNYAFHNNGNLTFTNVAAAWGGGVGAAGFSNGAAYVDLDNDGALDLVVNNVNAPAAIYRNRARELDSASRHYLTVTLRGTGQNTGGIGAKVMIAAGGTHQLSEVMPTRGFESAVDPRLHFGLGSARVVDSLTVVWPDRR